MVLARDVEMVSLRGGGGELGILPRHMALATSVKPGLIKLKLPEGEVFIPVSGGFLEVLPTRITLLADTAELPQEIDADRAEKAKSRAEQRLSGRVDGLDVARAEAALARAQARLLAVERAGEAGNPLR